jgi:serine protease Do
VRRSDRIALAFTLASLAPLDLPAQDAAGLRPQDPTEAEQELRVTPVVKAVRRAEQSVVSIYCFNENRPIRTRDGLLPEGQGSGVVLDEHGLVITNWHVVAQVEARPGFRVEVKFKGNQEPHAAELLSTSAEDDLALLQLRLGAGEKVTPVQLGDSDTLMVGETVIGIGNPQGHAHTVTVGVLSATDRAITVLAPDGRPRAYKGLLQTDAAINEGNSGGALLDITGRLIGINNAMVRGAQNIGFAIPVNTVRRVFRDKLLASENLAHMWLGMRVREENGAAVVADVDPQGPAHAVGIRDGDRLVRAGGARVATALDFARQVLEARPGAQFPLEVERDRRVLRVQPVPMTVVEREIWKRIGVQADMITPRSDRELVTRATRGFYEGFGTRRVALLPCVLRVREVQPDGPADAIEVKPGDLILGFQVQTWTGPSLLPIQSPEHCAQVLASSSRGRLRITVMRGDEVKDGDIYVK